MYQEERSAPGAVDSQASVMDGQHIQRSVHIDYGGAKQFLSPLRFDIGVWSFVAKNGLQPNKPMKGIVKGLQKDWNLTIEWQPVLRH